MGICISGWVTVATAWISDPVTRRKPGNAQDITENLLGKILRIDVTGDDFPEDELRNYAIPPSNPFVDQDGDDEIWAYGLRNPSRTSSTGIPAICGLVMSAKVAAKRSTFCLQVTRAAQFRLETSRGHHCDAESNRRRAAPARCNRSGIRLPAPVSRHGVLRPRTVTGGYVYRGPVAAFQGLYFFNDTNFPAKIWTLDPDAVDIPASVMSLAGKLPRSYDGIFIGQVPSWAEDADGNLYAVQLEANGGVFRVATYSQDVVWNGDNAAIGEPGDGQSWSHAKLDSRRGSGFACRGRGPCHLRGRIFSIDYQA